MLCLFCIPLLVDYCSHKLFAHKIPMHRKWVRLKCASLMLHDALLAFQFLSFMWASLKSSYLAKKALKKSACWEITSYVSNVSTFPNAFHLVLDSNLHDLNETNPGLTLFSAELPWYCFCVEIKVLGMERNFARILYNKREFLEPRVTWGGHLGGHNPPGHACAPRRAQVGCPHLVAPRTLTLTL